MFEERCVFVSAPELLWGSRQTSSRAHEHENIIPKVGREIDWKNLQQEFAPECARAL